MGNLILSLNIILPMLLLMSGGFALKQLNFLNTDTFKQINSVIYKVFLPIMLFSNVYTSNIKGLFNPKLIGFACIMLAAEFVVLLFVIPVLEKENSKRGVLIQGILRSNFVIFGLPVAIAILGDGNVGVTALLIVFVTPFHNLMAIAALSFFGSGKKFNFLDTAKKVLTNPIVFSALLAIIFLSLEVPLPSFLIKTLSDISKMTTPLALIALGGSFSFRFEKGNIKPSIIGVIGRILIVPLLFIPLSIIAGFRGEELVSLLALFGAPTAVSSYSAAINLGGDGDLASKIVVFTSIFSIFTMFLWIFILKQTGLI